MQPNENPSPPDWLRNVIVGMQKEVDTNYSTRLTVYNNEVNTWIAVNIFNRDNGRPFTAPPSKPVRSIIYATVDNSFGQYDAPVDPSIPDPVLPVGIPITPPTPLVTGAGQNQDVANKTLDLVTKIANLMGIK